MSQRVGMPSAQGLYDPANEHDNCGVGFIANIKGKKNHDIVTRGIDILCNLTHRGAVGADPLDGDGAGLTIQTPDALFRAIVDFELPPEGDYAAGNLFLPKDNAAREVCEAATVKAVEDTGLTVLGWRDVPTNPDGIGRNARSAEPKVRQIFIGRGNTKASQFELMLYLARKRAENAVLDNKLNGDEYYYLPSLSAATIVYKGMLLSEQLPTYYPELSDERLVSAVAFVHQRYSTNTFPTWDLAQPFRLVAHNGEINTLRGNFNRMSSRQAIFAHPDLGDAVKDLRPVIREGASDTAAFDNALELLVRCGYDLAHAMAMMTPEAWATKAQLPDDLKGFFEYHATMMEPWDGPANLVAFDGKQVCAALDRNGLRPARYWVTDDEEIVYASEAGVLNIAPEKIVQKGRLAPGKMILVDTVTGELLDDKEIKTSLAKKKPWASWVLKNLIRKQDLPAPPIASVANHRQVAQLQQAFGYTLEDLRVIMAPMCLTGQEPVGSMGTDTPVAILSERPKLLYWYFKQCFAQVTNPAIDPIREEVVMSLTQYLGSASNILLPGPASCRMLQIDQPVLSNRDLEQLRRSDIDCLKATTLSIVFSTKGGASAMEARLEHLFADAEEAIDSGHNIIVLSDRKVDNEHAPIPALLAVSAINHHLIRVGKRSQCSLLVESGEPREVHHFACLVGFGATAVNPYLAIEALGDMIDTGMLPQHDGNSHADDPEDAEAQYLKNYIKAINKGLYKVFSKIGISTLQSYCSAQIFDAIGLSQTFVDKYFTGTSTRIEGAGIEEIAEEALARHSKAFATQVDPNRELERGGEYHWRREGEKHLMNPEVIALLQHSVRAGSIDTFRRYSALIDNQAKRLCTLRGLFSFKKGTAIPLDEVEPVSAIARRFCTGAMSLGSISSEAHETLAIAMNRLGGKSNTGEGGEDARRFTPLANGDSKRSAIKQVASGRFGVTPHYLVNGDEIQIKVAQGAKPGEGGQLPGHKVSEYIASLRYSVPGVTLISPPPHHDIYSIEDLAQLIYDLKNCNPAAEISVKLVSEVGVGTVAAGVSKAHADRVVIAGYDGGTGASPMSSIKHAGTPWEIGLAETQQTLVLNDLRGRIKVQTDGQLRTGRDVVIAAMLGAEEYGFATVALVTIGCIMMRKCHLNTCPVGVATQDPSLIKKFSGNPDHVANFFTYLATEVREYLAELGFRSLDEIVGRSDLLETNKAILHWKNQGLDFSRLLAQPDAPVEFSRRCVDSQDHGIEEVLDRELISQAAPALDSKQAVTIDSAIHNYNRTTGAMLSGAVAKRHGVDGLPEDTITVNFKGISGQSFGCFLAPGVTFNLTGEGNDYVGKGMAGGRIVIRPDEVAPFEWSANQIVGNTVLYGATGGEVFFAGKAGERFCVRNSGCKAVVEGVGDHGCEYMTGGIMVCLGMTGRNFAAGMSGGLAFIYDEDVRFTRRCNPGMVDVEQLTLDEDIKTVRELVEKHAAYTGSPKAKAILADWSRSQRKFVKVFPREFRRVLNERAERARQEELASQEVSHNG